MSAKEMFEELDYIQTENSSSYISYEYKDGEDNHIIYRIVFIKRNKLIQICNDNGSYFITCDKRLIQAINKQVEELGWNK